jgi:hypothetical protein
VPSSINSRDQASRSPVIVLPFSPECLVKHFLLTFDATGKSNDEETTLNGTVCGEQAGKVRCDRFSNEATRARSGIAGPSENSHHCNQ